jgi:hypothetical protein
MRFGFPNKNSAYVGFLSLNCTQQNRFVHKAVFGGKEENRQREEGETLHVDRWNCTYVNLVLRQFGTIWDKYLIKKREVTINSKRVVDTLDNVSWIHSMCRGYTR